MARVRQALGAEGSTTEEPLERPVCHVTAEPIPQADRVRRFESELRRVGGRVAIVRSSEEIGEYIRRLIADKAAIVAISDGAAEQEPNLREFVAGLGAKLIPSLREYSLGLDNPTSSDHADAYKRALFEADLGITCADYAIADTGTLVISSKRPGQKPPATKDSHQTRSSGEQHRLISLVPATHVCLLDASNIVTDLTEFLAVADASLYSGGAPPLGMTFITGPSRTADIELTLTMGVHGPRELHVLVCEPDNPNS